MSDPLASFSTLLGRVVRRFTLRPQKDACVVVEVCFPSKRTLPKYRFGGEDGADCSGSCQLRLTGLTPSGQAVHRSSLFHPHRLVYFRMGEEEGNREFVFKKDFAGYTATWSGWEACDFVFDKTKQENSFFWLATRDKDRTHEIGRLEGEIVDGPKARFKVVPFAVYLETIKRDTDLTLEADIPDCPL